jgi:hypothetical protein
VIRLGELFMILDLHQQRLSVSGIAANWKGDRKTARKSIERGLEAPAYGPREPRATVVRPFAPYDFGTGRLLFRGSRCAIRKRSCLPVRSYRPVQALGSTRRPPIWMSALPTPRSSRSSANRMALRGKRIATALISPLGIHRIKPPRH